MDTGTALPAMLATDKRPARRGRRKGRKSPIPVEAMTRGEADAHVPAHNRPKRPNPRVAAARRRHRAVEQALGAKRASQ